MTFHFGHLLASYSLFIFSYSVFISVQLLELHFYFTKLHDIPFWAVISQLFTFCILVFCFHIYSIAEGNASDLNRFTAFPCSDCVNSKGTLQDKTACLLIHVLNTQRTM